jgi:hypothetical protein
MERVTSGIAIAPEGRRLFPDMTVRENLAIGGYCRPKSHEARNLERVLDLFRLRDRNTTPAQRARRFDCRTEYDTSVGSVRLCLRSSIGCGRLAGRLTSRGARCHYDSVHRLTLGARNGCVFANL